MTYVIRNIETGRYVVPITAMKSDTQIALEARRFDTEEQARACCCAGEEVIHLETFTRPFKLHRRPESVTVHELIQWLDKKQRTVFKRSVEAALRDMTK